MPSACVSPFLLDIRDAHDLAYFCCKSQIEPAFGNWMRDYDLPNFTIDSCGVLVEARRCFYHRFLQRARTQIAVDLLLLGS